jgi:hypothetical protein
MTEIIIVLKQGLASSSDGIVGQMRETVKIHARTMEGRQWTLPFKVRGETIKIREQLNVAINSVLAFKDCASLVAGLDPHGIAPTVCGGVATVLEVNRYFICRLIRLFLKQRMST